MRSKMIWWLLPLLLLVSSVQAALPFRFAFITDMHIQAQDSSSVQLRHIIQHINQSDSIDFVLVGGDMVEYADVPSFRCAKQLLDSLHIPYYVVPGNHDTLLKGRYSDGYKTVFGTSHFVFLHKGVRFVGFSTAPHKAGKGEVGEDEFDFFAQLMRDTIHTPSPTTIAVTHYPLLRGDVKNPDTIIQSLRLLNTQLVLCGHYHRNAFFPFQEILGIVNRATYRTSDQSIGYNLYTLYADHTVEVQEVNPHTETHENWLKYPLHSPNSLSQND